MVEVAVADEHRIRMRDQPVDPRRIAAQHAVERQIPEGCPGQVGVDHDRRPPVCQTKPGRAQPLELQACGQVDAVAFPVEVGLHARIVAMTDRVDHRRDAGRGHAP